MVIGQADDEGGSCANKAVAKDRNWGAFDHASL